MYIQPSTEIHILQNIPLNKSYEHTVFYKDAQTQATEFLKFEKYMLTDYSYQRANIGTLRVELKYENLYNCNYLMFKNNAFENKWFYAFITGVSYVSNEVSEIYYEIDVMQTWCYDYTFLKTFIDRQHSATDALYENTQPEGLELGCVYGIVERVKLYPMNVSGDAYFLILATTTPDGRHPTPKVVHDSLFGLYTHVGNIDDSIDTLKTFINNGLESNIVAIYSCPPDNQLTMDGGYSRPQSIGAYHPRNYKLFTYPYSFLCAYNGLGQELELHFENFRDANGNPQSDFKYEYSFRVLTTQLPQPQSNLLVKDYLGYGGYQFQYYTLTYNVFPTGAFSGDTFKVWLAQNKNTYSASMNAIGNTYDTNQRIISNNYTMASLSASTALSNSGISANTALANANASNQTALAINESNRQFGQVQNGVNGIGGVIGNTLSGNIGGAVNSALNMGLSMYGTDLSASNTASTLATDLANTNRSVGASQTIARNSYSVAMKNASMSEVNANLSNLNAYQNATAQLVAKKQDIMHHPSNLHGALMNDSWNAWTKRVGFTIYEKFIKREYAEKIDEYFDKYGYAQNTAYVPKRLNRKHYTYLKTVGCNIVGKMNNNDILTIKGIYDNGITTWDTLQNVGHYEIDNSIERG